MTYTKSLLTVLAIAGFIMFGYSNDDAFLVICIVSSSVLGIIETFENV